MARDLSEFIKISPGFKAAVNLRNERDNLRPMEQVKAI